MGLSRRPQTKRLPSAAASINADTAETSASYLLAINGLNAKAAVVYLKLYNLAVAPDPAEDVPEMTLACKASEPFKFDGWGEDGYFFDRGIAYLLTTDAADDGATALLAADVLGLNISYK